VASFIVAFRVASLVTTVQNALNGYYGPRYARSFARSDRSAIAHLLRSSQLVAAVLCAPVVLVIPWAGALLSLFGETYADANIAYAILAVGQFINAVTGLVSYVLSLSHREKTLTYVNLASLLVLIVGWGAMWLFNSTSLTIYCIVFSIYLIAKNVVNYVLARRVIRSMPEPQ
jgi:O-antigen/teichoic acid export membrane protein